jgi:hypothetical protein
LQLGIAYIIAEIAIITCECSKSEEAACATEANNAYH